jgi:hypothetical protein
MHYERAPRFRRSKLDVASYRRLAGDMAGDQFCAKAYDVDPSKPIGSIKEAWEVAKLRAGRALKGIPEATESEERSRPSSAASTI